jgi:hypothetical protein
VSDLSVLIDKMMSGEGDVNISDLTSLIDYLLKANNDVKDMDVNEDGIANTDDVVALINQILSA